MSIEFDTEQRRIVDQQTLVTLFYLCQKWGDEQIDLTYNEAVDVYCEVAEKYAVEHGL